MRHGEEAGMTRGDRSDLSLLGRWQGRRCEEQKEESEW